MSIFQSYFSISNVAEMIRSLDGVQWMRVRVACLSLLLNLFLHLFHLFKINTLYAHQIGSICAYSIYFNISITS